MKKFIEGSPGVKLSGQKADPKVIGKTLPVIQATGLELCDSFQRMLDRYPVPYYLEEDSNIRKLVHVEADQLCKISEEFEDISEAHHVATADGFSLEALGILLNVVRREGETDESLATRIKAKLPTLTGGGTIPHLQKIVAAEIGCDESDVLISDGFLRAWHGPHYEYVLKLNGDATDWEGNHNGVEVGAPTYDSARFDDGLSEPDDVNYVRIPDDSAFDTDDFAVWAWISPSDVSGTKYVKIKSDGSDFEWYIRVVDGQVQAKVNLSTADAEVDSGSIEIKNDRVYFVMLKYDSSSNKATLYLCEDGQKGMMVRPDKFESSGTGGRVYLAMAAHIYLGRNPISAGEYWTGWIDHVGYVADDVDDKLVDEICYCAPGLDHYGHFSITIAGGYDINLISYDQWDNATEAVEKNKAAGTTFEGFTNGPREEYVGVFDEGHIYHHTEITWSDSLNVTYPG